MRIEGNIQKRVTLGSLSSGTVVRNVVDGTLFLLADLPDELYNEAVPNDVCLLINMSTGETLTSRLCNEFLEVDCFLQINE